MTSSGGLENLSLRWQDARWDQEADTHHQVTALIY